MSTDAYGKPHPHPNRQAKAQNMAVSGMAGGVALIVSGIAYIMWGPVGADAVNTWFVGSIVVGAMLVFLSVMAYFTYMEKLEPQLYQHEDARLRHHDEWNQGRQAHAGTEPVGPDVNLR